GVVVGRNVFQHPNPRGMVRAIAAVVHEGREPEEALRYLE
ncbi:MAG: fructose-bisphosphate aldolase, partial [Thermoprotei archaeon]